MILIVCLDDRNGMTFLKRRLSQDAALRAHMLDMTRGSILWMNGYSGRQFDRNEAHMRIDENFLNVAGQGEYCFAENTDVLPVRDRVEKLVIYRWNRQYPSDVKFPLEVFVSGMRPQILAEFPGTSHELITQEVYSL